MNFNDIFKKNVTYDNLKSHKKTRTSHPLSRKYIFEENTEVAQIDPLPTVAFLAQIIRFFIFDVKPTKLCSYCM